MFHNRRQLISAARRPFVAAGGGGYVGPGDMATYFAWYGLRGYNAAYTGSAIDIFDSGSANPATISIDPTTHLLNMVTLNAWIALHGTASVTKIYDQTGGNRHVLSDNFTQSPMIEVGSTDLKSGYPSMLLSSVTGTALHITLDTTISQPFSTSGFVWATSGSATGGYLGDSTNFSGAYLTGDGNASLYAGNSIFEIGAAAAETWHAMNCLANGSASYIYVNTTPGSAQDAGTNGMSSGHELTLGRAFNNFNGKLCEAGVINADQRSNFLTLAANQRAFWLP